MGRKREIYSKTIFHELMENIFRDNTCFKLHLRRNFLSKFVAQLFSMYDRLR